MSAFEDQVRELFAPIPGVEVRRMFGGLGIMRNGMMIAVGTQEVLYFKADDTTSPAFEAEGSPQWIYERKGEPVPMPYWQVPDRLMDDPDEFVVWAGRAFAVAKARKAAQARKPAAKRKPMAAKPMAAKKAVSGKKAAAGKKPAAKPASKKPASVKKPAARKAAARKPPRKR